MSSRGEDEWLPRPAVSGPVTWQDFTGKGGEPPSEGREVGEQWETRLGVLVWDGEKWT